MAKWTPGVSGNPTGKPKGTKSKYGIALLEENRRALLKALVDKALKGDIQALNILAERLWPRLRQIGRPIVLPPASGLLARSEIVLSATFSGEIAPDEGKLLMDALVAQAKVQEVYELQKRVEILEDKINKPFSYSDTNASDVPPVAAELPDAGGRFRTPLNLDEDEEEFIQ